MIKKFYVIRFEDGQYFAGRDKYTRCKVDFSKARLYTKKNHASLSMNELELKKAQVIELTVEEPE